MVRNGITSSYITRRPGANRLGSFCVAVIVSLRNNNYNLTRDINGRILKKEGDLKLNITTC